MQQRWAVSLVVMTMVWAVGPSRLQAQGSKPQTYSLTEDPGIPIMGPEVVKISRDGSKEVVDQIMPPMPGRDKEYHGHLLYDFQAHRLYTQVVSDPSAPCGIQEYNDPAAPKEFDVISGGAALMKEMNGPNAKSRQVGTETLNGIPAKVVEITSPQATGKVWFTQNGNYPVKIVIIGKDGKETTFLEVKQLSFSKPPAATFTLPASCAGLQVARTIKPSTNVTALTLQPIPKYTGPCPAHIKMVGTITVDGPGTVFYQFGAGKFDPGETVTFSAAGTKTVTHVMTFQPMYGNDMGGGAVLEAIGADASGNHGMLTQGSNNADFNITCTSGGGK